MKKINDNFEKLFPKEKAIVMLHAHADDESFLSAGIINEFVTRDYNILLIYLATGLVDGDNRPILRQKELFSALELLGVQNVDLLKYCEPKYLKNGKPLYLQSIQEVIEGIKTSIRKRGIKEYILFSYDKNGGYGNRDHLVVHKVGRLLLKNSSNLSSLFEVTFPREIYLDWFLKKEGKVSENYLPKLSYWSKEFGLVNNEIDYVYSLNIIQVDKKRNALSKHQSQIQKDEFPLTLTDVDFQKLFGKEYFSYLGRSIAE